MTPIDGRQDSIRTCPGSKLLLVYALDFFAKSETISDFYDVPLAYDQYMQDEAHKIILTPVKCPSSKKMDVSVYKCLAFCQTLARHWPDTGQTLPSQEEIS